MEKTVQIDGQSVRLRANASSTRRYKMQFQSDFFADILKLNSLTKFLDKKGNVNINNLSEEERAKIDFEVLYNLIWTFAKTADKSIPEPLEWEEQFESFPLEEIISEITDLITVLINSKKK